MVIVKLLDLYFPCNSVSFCIVLESNGEVASLIKFPERGGT